MNRFLYAVLFSLFLLNSTLANALNIEAACQVRDQIKNSLLGDFSASVGKWHLSGQCVGATKPYHHSDKISINCSEYLEQKATLLEGVSTTLTEAYQSGICVGTIYQVYDRPLQSETYITIATYISEHPEPSLRVLFNYIRDNY